MGNMSRKIARNKVKKAQAGLGDAIRTFASLEGIKDLSGTLVALKQIGPMLEEVRDATLLLIREKALLERQVSKDRSIFLGMMAHFAKTDPEAVTEMFETLGERWEKNNPISEHLTGGEVDTVPAVIASTDG